MRRTWRVVAGHTAAALVALAIASFTFVYRFGALGGSLGGFDDDHFPVLVPVEMVLRGQQPLRDFADAGLRGAWPALSYEVPAWAQRTWGRNLLSEAYVTVGILAACAGLVFVIARWLSGRWIVALLAGATIVVSGAELYNYPKVLTMTLAVPLLVWALAARSWLRLAVLAAWTAIAGLFRHDYAVYLVLASVAGLVVRDAGMPRVAARYAGVYVGFLVLWLLPSAIWVQRYAGIPQYVATILNSRRLESGTRSLREWPVVDLAAPFSDASLTAFIYYVFWAIPLIAIVLVMVRLAHNEVRLKPDTTYGVGVRLKPDATYEGVASGFSRKEIMIATGTALATLTILANHFFLRSNLESRFGDGASAIVLLTAWMAGTSRDWSSRSARALGWIVPSLVFALTFGAMFQLNALAQELSTAGILRSPADTRSRFREVQDALRRLPPVDWSDADSSRTLAVARYVAECTGPDDYLLLGGYSAEIPVFARRRLAAGQGLFALGFYTSEADQRRAIEHLRQEQVPIVAVRSEFATDYPLVWQYIRSRYSDAGTIDVGDNSPMHILVEANRTPRRMHPAVGLPCFR